MGTFDDRVLKPISLITGALLGQDLLTSLKAKMLEQNVYRLMFGEKGERIFCNEMPSYNDSILPLAEFYWKGERLANWDVYQTGTIDGRFVLPVVLKGDFERMRLVAATFHRFFNTLTSDFFKAIPGLTEIGNGIDFQYDRMLALNGIVVPVLPFQMPVKFDGKLQQQQLEDVDLFAALDADAIGWAGTYQIKITDENQNVLIPTGDLATTEKPNG